MRGLLGVLAVIVLVVIAALAFGFIDIDQDQQAKLPSVEVKGGQLPEFDADVADVNVGTTNETIEVPKIETEKETIQVPTISVDKAKADEE